MTLLVIVHDLDKSRNMKLILYVFEQAPGLEINFHKNELLCFVEAREHLDFCTELFGCKVGNSQ
jgi:hypothetical protein